MKSYKPNEKCLLLTPKTYSAVWKEYTIFIVFSAFEHENGNLFNLENFSIKKFNN